MKPVRRLMTRLLASHTSPASDHDGSNNSSSTKPAANIKSTHHRGGAAAHKAFLSESAAAASTAEAIHAQLAADRVNTTDLQEAILSTKPSSKDTIMNKYTAWQQEFGSV